VSCDGTAGKSLQWSDLSRERPEHNATGRETVRAVGAQATIVDTPGDLDRTPALLKAGVFVYVAQKRLNSTKDMPLRIFCLRPIYPRRG
jgi:hypothetical protein